MNGEHDAIISLQNLIAMEMLQQNQILNAWRRPRIQRMIRDAHLQDKPKEPRFERVLVDGDIISYVNNDLNKVGVYIAAEPLSPQDSYYEVEILDTGMVGAIGVGLVPYRYPLDSQPGWRALSVGYHADDGKVFKSCGFGKAFGPKCHAGDKVGCGIKFQTEAAIPGQNVKVFFTRNGKEVGEIVVPLPGGGLYPSVGMHSDGEEIKLTLDAEWIHDDVMQMAVDNGEEEWARLHDIHINGSVLEYAGRGKSVHDVALAQARVPLDTTYYYFEIEIVDPGEKCYVAIGLARRNYPKHRHPGWNKGSIAYHADDGKIFAGSGQGDPFGPRCYKGDNMGCGILFPPDYDSDAEADSPASPDEQDDINDPFNIDDYLSSDSEDEEMYPKNGDAVEEEGPKVKVFFTRNGKIIGHKEICIPKGGFFPTIGMISSCEKVRVDLRPLTG